MASCDKCSAPCCKILHIPEINKNHSIVCGHLSNNKCKVYKTRPQTCKKFQCIYLSSNWPKKYHPDSCGLLFVAIHKGPVRVFQTKDQPLNKDAEEILDHVSKLYKVEVMNFEPFKSANSIEAISPTSALPGAKYAPQAPWGVM